MTVDRVEAALALHTPATKKPLLPAIAQGRPKQTTTKPTYLRGSLVNYYRVRP